MKGFKGLLLTDEIRGSLQVAVEEAIKCHFSALEQDIKNLEKDARKERIALYKETVEVCSQMKEQEEVGAKALRDENTRLKTALETIRDLSVHCDIYDLKSIASEALNGQEVEGWRIGFY